jgi:hypothetical protein
MSYREHGLEQNEPGIIQGRNFVGYVLILCGAAIAFWVVFNVYGLFNEPAKLTPFQELVASNLETTISHANQEGFKLVIPSEVLSYFIPLFLLVIAFGVAGMLVTNGVRLLCGLPEKRPAPKTP